MPFSLSLSLYPTNKIKQGTEGLASPNSNMIAPQEKDRESDWIQVQSKKSYGLARKKVHSQVNKFQPSCKHHTFPDSLIHPDISYDEPPWQTESKKPCTRNQSTRISQKSLPSMHQLTYKIMTNRSYKWSRSIMRFLIRFKKITKQHIKEMLQPHLCNNTRLLSIKTTANDCQRHCIESIVCMYRQYKLKLNKFMKNKFKSIRLSHLSVRQNKIIKCFSIILNQL